MDGWVDSPVGGWMDGWMDGWMGERMEGGLDFGWRDGLWRGEERDKWIRKISRRKGSDRIG